MGVGAGVALFLLAVLLKTAKYITINESMKQPTMSQQDFETSKVVSDERMKAAKKELEKIQIQQEENEDMLYTKKVQDIEYSMHYPVIKW